MMLNNSGSGGVPSRGQQTGYNFGSPQMSYNGQPVQQPSPTPPMPFVGRYVNSLTDILPNEVPMDGRVGIFPNSDLNEIYLKTWSSDGTIKTFRYIFDATTDLNSPNTTQQDPTYDQLTARIDALEKMIRKNGNRNRDKPMEEVKA